MAVSVAVIRLKTDTSSGALQNTDLWLARLLRFELAPCLIGFSPISLNNYYLDD